MCNASCPKSSLGPVLLRQVSNLYVVITQEEPKSLVYVIISRNNSGSRYKLLQLTALCCNNSQRQRLRNGWIKQCFEAKFILNKKHYLVIIIFDKQKGATFEAIDCTHLIDLYKKIRLDIASPKTVVSQKISIGTIWTFRYRIKKNINPIHNNEK